VGFCDKRVAAEEILGLIQKWKLELRFAVPPNFTEANGEPKIAGFTFLTRPSAIAKRDTDYCLLPGPSQSQNRLENRLPSGVTKIWLKPAAPSPKPVSFWILD